jgi:hypothetical protein
LVRFPTKTSSLNIASDKRYFYSQRGAMTGAARCSLQFTYITWSGILQSHNIDNLARTFALIRSFPSELSKIAEGGG